jgi:hypothetical protein
MKKERVAKIILAGIALSAAAISVWRVGSGWTFFLAAPVHGDVLGKENGVTVYSNGEGNSIRGEYGLEYECVELVNRYYVQVLEHRNLTQTGHADSYFWDANAKGLVAFPNRGTTKPAVHDVLVFDGGPDDGSVGHIAIITRVDEKTKRVEFIQQNIRARTDVVFTRDVWKDTLALERTLGGEWFVNQGRYPTPVAGWSRVAQPAERN